jgi:hypothetical protein
MKAALVFAQLGLAASLSLATVMLLGGCAGHENAPQYGKALAQVYDTAEEIQAMPVCEAVVVERGPCYVRLRTAEGIGFLIGSPAAGEDVVQFLYVLKDNRTYKFPETFQKYEAQRHRTGYSPQ